MLQLTLPVGAADPEPFENALEAAGAVSITLEDAGDDPVLEPAPGTTPLWPKVNIKALFDPTTDRAALLARLRNELGEALAGATFELLAERAWEREWLKEFRPMRFGQRLWICPGGQRPPQDVLADPRTCCIELDPGLAFGTGTHPTTALCLEWLDGAALAGKHVTDYGCGSGVLAIAALKLGAAEALAVDIDPQALIATRDNAERNGLAARLTVGSIEMPQRATDILLANILAGPLEELAESFAQRVRAGGTLILSGILGAQADRVASRYAAWFDMRPATIRDDWVRLEGMRRPSPRAC